VFKKIVIVLLFICSPVFAGELATFEAITQDLDVGNEIKVVVHGALCTMDDPNESKIPVSTMVIKPSALLFTDNLLSFDVTKFASRKYPFANNGLLQRGTFLLNSSGQVNIVIAFFDAETNKKIPQWNDVKIQCQLGVGVKVYQG
jgi:hypothetical protein